MEIFNYESNVYFLVKSAWTHMVVIKMTEHMLDFGAVAKMQRDN